MLRLLAIRASLGARAPCVSGVHGRGVVGLAAGDNPREVRLLNSEIADGAISLPVTLQYH
jgi:hypothetical protein